jgi:predicted MFS family arabinose efflux permease
LVPLTIVRRPHVARLLLAAIVGRIPSAIGALAIGLVLRREGWSYDGVGLVLGIFAVGLAVGGPALGRLVDRRGQAKVLAGSAVMSGLGFLLVALPPASTGAVLGGAAVAGLATPPLEPCLRALWRGLVRADELDAALGLDACAQELIFIIGPLLVVACAATGDPAVALWLAAALDVAGTVLFLTAPPSHGWRPVPRPPHWLGPLRSAGLVVLLVGLVGSGAAIGALNLVTLAYAESHRVSGGAGVLLALNAAGGLLGAVAYGSIRWRLAPPQRLLLLTAGMAVAYWSLVSIPGTLWMAALMVLTGLFLAPVLAVAFAMVGTLSRPENVTEAFAWLVTLFTVGAALGSPVAGWALNNGIGAGAAVAAGGATTAVAIALGGQRAWSRADAGMQRA